MPLPAPYTQAAPTFAPAQPPTQYQHPWPGPGGWGSQWGGQGQTNQTILRVAQASAIGLFISGGFLAFVALIALAAPDSMTDENLSPGAVVIVGLLFAAAAAVQLAAGYGVLRRRRWAAWAGGLTAGIGAVLFLLTLTAVTFLLAVGEAFILGGIAFAARRRWFA